MPTPFLIFSMDHRTGERSSLSELMEREGSGMSDLFKERCVAGRFKIYLLCLIFALVWIRAVFGEFANIDDNGLVAFLQGAPHTDFNHFFAGIKTDAGYSRPLLHATYHAEAFFGLLNPPTMRLDNLLLHLANTLWIYLILGKISELNRRSAGWWPFCSALLFGLHPLATESVNWVSGRSDLLVGFFVFASTWCSLSYRKNSSQPVLILAFVSAICAILSKEVAFAFLPGLFLLLGSRLPAQDLPETIPLRTPHRLLGLLFCFFLALCAFFALHSLPLTTNIKGGIGRTLLIMQRDLFYDSMLFVRLFGFYFKKILAPWPLNLAIDGVDPLYDLLGVVIVLIVLWLFLRNRFSTDFFVVAALLLIPVYPISFGQIAWTPYAERYAYMSAAFCICGVYAVTIEKLRDEFTKRILNISVVCLILIFGITTYQRNTLWQSNLTLWADTVQKSPDFAAAHRNYAVTLFQHGDFSAAGKEYDLARAGGDNNYSPENGIIYGAFLDRTGRRVEAVAAFRDVLSKTNGKSPVALQELVTLCSRSSQLLESCGGPSIVAADLERLYSLNSEPQWLVKAAELFASGGESQKALELFRRAEIVLLSTDPLLAIVKEKKKRLIQLERR